MQFAFGYFPLLAVSFLIRHLLTRNRARIPAIPRTVYNIPTVYLVTVLSILNTFKVFREAYLIAGPYPRDDSIYMLQHLFNNWFTKLDIQKMCSAAVIVALVITVIILLLQSLDRKLGEDV